MEKVYKKLIEGIKDYFWKNNVNKAVIGLSGGIDSALSARLVSDAIGKENLRALIMPVKGLSSEENVKDAIELCNSIGIEYYLIYINDFIKEFKRFRWQTKIAKMNTLARIRAVILYNYANSKKSLVIGTSNKTEIMLGYFTKYGDGAVDIEVISDMFKTEEIKLAKFLKIPQKIIKKTPTAELYHGQTDEDELGGTYAEIDDILIKLDKKQKIDKKNTLVKKIIKRMKDNEHKNKLPHFIRL